MGCGWRSPIERRPDAAVVVVGQRAQRRRAVAGEGRAVHQASVRGESSASRRMSRPCRG